MAQEAFATIPPAYHDRLWGSRLLFQSKLGQDCTAALEQLKSRSPVLQVRALPPGCAVPLHQCHDGVMSIAVALVLRCMCAQVRHFLILILAIPHSLSCRPVYGSPLRGWPLCLSIKRWRIKVLSSC